MIRHGFSLGDFSLSLGYLPLPFFTKGFKILPISLCGDWHMLMNWSWCMWSSVEMLQTYGMAKHLQREHFINQLGGVSYCAFVCLLTKYLKIFDWHFIFGGSLPSDPGKKWLNIEKKNHQRVRVRGWKSWPNDKKQEKKIQALIAAKLCKIDIFGW